MLITLNIKNDSKVENFLSFLKTLDYVEVEENHHTQQMKHTKNQNKFGEFAGIWNGREITQESLRADAWKK